MKPPVLQSLEELCYIRVAYLSLCRNMAENFEEAPVELSDGMGIPPILEPTLFKHNVIVYNHLLALIRLWLPRTLYQKPLEWVTGEMLCECLELDVDGLIHQRKTAEKLIRSREFDIVFAFRLACMNFLEQEVLQLWFHVKQFFLKKITEYGYIYRDEGPKHYPCHDPSLYRQVAKVVRLKPCPWTTEPYEVLFWIGYCLSQDKGIDIQEIPHFAGKNVDWYQFALEWAAFSCNVACFDYFSTKIEYDYMETIIKILSSKEDRQMSAFIFHFRLLEPGERVEMFRQFPIKMVSIFLQWPLSLAFMRDHKTIWDLIPNILRDWIFFKIFALLFYRNASRNRNRNMEITYKGHRIFRFDCPGKVAGLYNLKHLQCIWIYLWRSSSDSLKLYILDSVVLKSIEKSANSRRFCSEFEKSDLKERLRNLFLPDGEKVFELYREAKLKNSLKKLVDKYMSKDSKAEAFDECISLLKDETEQITFETPEQEYRNINLNADFTPISHNKPIHKGFFNHLESVLSEL